MHDILKGAHHLAGRKHVKKVLFEDTDEGDSGNGPCARNIAKQELLD